MITHITVEEAAKLISSIVGTNEIQALTYIREAADRGEIQTADALEKLQSENAYMRELLHRYCSCKVCANAADSYGLHCKFGGCNGGGNGFIEEDRWALRKMQGHDCPAGEKETEVQNERPAHTR